MPVEVRHLNVVIISDRHLASRPKPHQREHLDVLAAQGPSANHEGLGSRSLGNEVLPEQHLVVVVPTVLDLPRPLCNDLKEVVVQPLVERRELAGALDDLLRGHSSPEGHHGADLRLAVEAVVLDHFGVDLFYLETAFDVSLPVDVLDQAVDDAGQGLAVLVAEQFWQAAFFGPEFQQSPQQEM